MEPVRNHLLAFVLRLVVSASVLWLSVAWVAPDSSRNSFGRAVLVSLLLSCAYYLTLARFLWFLVVPWLIYVAIWLAVIMVSYGIGFFRSLLLALVLAFLSWLSSMLLGIRTLRG
jgi:putative membrane protein